MMSDRDRFSGWPTPSAESAGVIRNLLACIRYREVFFLQCAPWLGAAFALRQLSAGRLANLALFAGADFLLVAHIWSLNDWSDSQADRFDANKAAGVYSTKGVTPSAMLSFSLTLLVASLGLFLLLPRQTVLIALAIALLGTLYSLSGFKRIPLASSALHFAGGALHFLLGYSLFSILNRNAFLLAWFFGLVLMAGHATQEVQDWEFDRLSGTRTNAVQFGPMPVFIASLAIFGLAYAYLFILAVAGVAPRRVEMVLAVLPVLHLFWSVRTLQTGLTFDCLGRLRARYRMLFAVIGVTLASKLLFP